jgi:hypothetical protein
MAFELKAVKKEKTTRRQIYLDNFISFRSDNAALSSARKESERHKRYIPNYLIKPDFSSSSRKLTVAVCLVRDLCEGMKKIKLEKIICLIF